MRQATLLVGILAALGACNSNGVVLYDLAPPPDLLSTCVPGTRATMNGQPQTVTLVFGSKTLQTSCCVELGTVSFLLPPTNASTPVLRLSLLHYIGHDPIVTPLRVDAAALGNTWALTIEHLECTGTGPDPCATGMMSVDRLTSSEDAFTGSFDVSGPEGNRTVTFCLQAKALSTGNTTTFQSVELTAHDIPLR
jgi:hypothetical protein